MSSTQFEITLTAVTPRKSSAWYTAGGFLYGLWLLVISFGLTGMGHGTFIPMTIAAAPVGRLIPMTSLLIPLLWAYAFRLAHQASVNPVRFEVIMLLHYLGAIVSAVWPFEEDWSYFWKMYNFSPAVVWVWVLSYAGAHIIAWTIYGSDSASENERRLK